MSIGSRRRSRRWSWESAGSRRLPSTRTIFSKGEAKGRAEAGVEEDRTLLLGLGRDKFGPPDEQVEARIAAIADQARLHQLLHAILRVSTWEELMGSNES